MCRTRPCGNTFGNSGKQRSEFQWMPCQNIPERKRVLVFTNRQNCQSLTIRTDARINGTAGQCRRWPCEHPCPAVEDRHSSQLCALPNGDSCHVPGVISWPFWTDSSPKSPLGKFGGWRRGNGSFPESDFTDPPRAVARNRLSAEIAHATTSAMCISGSPSD